MRVCLPKELRQGIGQKYALINHGSLQSPLPDECLWRYMNLGKFENLLETNSLFFSRGSTIQKMDQLEGTFPKENYTWGIEKYMSLFPNPNREMGEKLCREALNRGMNYRFNCFLSCWNSDDKQSEYMWKTYCKNKGSIVIKTQMKKLRESFGEYVDYEILNGLVDYIDFDKDIINLSGPFQLMFKKEGKKFKEDKELRLLLIDQGSCNSLFPEDEPTLVMFGDHSESDVIRKIPGKYVPIKPDILIDEIYLKPGSSDNELRTVQDLCNKFGLDKEVKFSEI